MTDQDESLEHELHRTRLDLADALEYVAELEAEVARLRRVRRKGAFR